MNEEQIVLDNVNLIYLVLKKLNLYSKCDEWFDVGMIGLVKGSKKYDASLGYSQSTFLYRCISNEIMMELRKHKLDTISLDTFIKENLTVKDMIKDKQNIEKNFLIEEKNKKIRKAILKLDEKEQVVIKATFKLYEFESIKTTQIELAKMLNVGSQAMISRIKKRALKKLKKELKEEIYYE